MYFKNKKELCNIQTKFRIVCLIKHTLKRVNSSTDDLWGDKNAWNNIIRQVSNKNIKCLWIFLPGFGKECYYKDWFLLYVSVRLFHFTSIIISSEILYERILIIRFITAYSTFILRNPQGKYFLHISRINFNLILEHHIETDFSYSSILV